MAIPKIIHQTIKDRSSVPKAYLKNIEHLKATNPNYEYHIYDNSDAIAFISKNYDAATLKRFKSINEEYGAAKADYFRYLLLYRLGGVYLDIKSTALKNLDQVLHDEDEYLLSHWKNKPNQRYAGYGIYPELSKNGEYQTWHIVASPEHPFLEKVINFVNAKIDLYDPVTSKVGHLGAMQNTGPIAYTKAIEGALENNKGLFRLVDIEDLGFVYSIFDKDNHLRQHENFQSTHYNYLTSPVILKSS